MTQQNILDSISPDVIQSIYQCIFQAIGEDCQEAETHLEIKTHISKPFMTWDLIYRNLINKFGTENVLYSTTKRGMWEVLLLFDKDSGLLLSFMRDNRFKTLQKSKPGKKPQYVDALLLCNNELQSATNQQSFFKFEEQPEDEERLKSILNELCLNFSEPVLDAVTQHALIVFSSKFGQVSSLNAFILNKNWDVVVKKDWMNNLKPIIANTLETVSENNDEKIPLKLKGKAKERTKQKELVSIKISKDNVKDQE